MDWCPEDVARIQHELEQPLGPELVSSRIDPRMPGTTYYLSFNQARSLANDIFGSENWSTQIKWDTIESVSEEQRDGVTVFAAAASCCVRVTLRNGVFREDVGCSHAYGATKIESIRKAKSIAKSDATKRALRQFGAALGNCLYDNTHTSGLATLALS